MSGLYAADGSWNVTVVSGLSNVGIYAADGSINVILSPGNTNVGAYHPCGAWYVSVAPANTWVPARAPDGSLYVYTGAYTGVGQRVTVVSGSLGPSGPSAVILPTPSFGSSNLVAWYDISKTWTDSNGVVQPSIYYDTVGTNTVGAWEDMSGNGYGWIQGDKSLQPTKGVNGGPQFDVAAMQMICQSNSMFNGLNKVSIYALARPTAGTTKRTLIYASEGATATPATAAAIATGGSQYVVNDYVTMTGGTAASQVVVKVRTVDGSGAILTADMVVAGLYTTPPANPVLQASSNLTSIVQTSTNLTSISNASPAVFTLTAHGLVAGDGITLATTGALPTGLTVGTTYYVIATGLTANAFRVSLTPGGAAINTSSAGSGTHSFTVGAVFTLAAHGLTLNQPITLATTGALPTGLTAGTIYYVIAGGLATNSFRVSASIGGAPVQISSAGSGTHSFTQGTGFGATFNLTVPPRGGSQAVERLAFYFASGSTTRKKFITTSAADGAQNLTSAANGTSWGLANGGALTDTTTKHRLGVELDYTGVTAAADFYYDGAHDGSQQIWTPAESAPWALNTIDSVITILGNNNVNAPLLGEIIAFIVLAEIPSSARRTLIDNYLASL